MPIPVRALRRALPAALRFAAHIALLPALCLCMAAACAAPKNIIIMFADGAAPAQWELGRYASHLLRKQPFVVTDTLFREGSLGLLATHPAGLFITDSAAGATALGTGFKSNNGAVAILPDGSRPRTVIEAAKQNGKRTGLVTTAEIYDASPAAFSVHAQSRREHQAIVDQYLALAPDVLLGGGRDAFLPQGAGGKRSDGRDVIAAFADLGYATLRDAAGLKETRSRRLLGLFADRSLAFDLDRDPAREPTVAAMTGAALLALSGPTADDRGFVLFVESQDPDHAGHANDVASLIRALWAFDDAVAVALAFQRTHPDTLLLITADHETGGFSATYARKDIAAGPASLVVGPAEFEKVMRIGASLDAVAAKLGPKPGADALDALVSSHFPGFTLDADLRDAILQRRPLERNFSASPHAALGRMVARQTGFYWGSSGHTAQPVATGAIGPGAELFRGYRDNTEFGTALLELIDGH
jgi:alkaline phosphatase